jgi:hypothetical protein
MKKRERNLKKLVDLMMANGEKSLAFVGVYSIYRINVSNLWLGLETGKFYLESRNSCSCESGARVSLFLAHLVSFQELGYRLKEGDRELKRLIRFQFDNSLIELLLEDNRYIVRLGHYCESLDIRIWYLPSGQTAYIETPVGAYRKNDLKDLCEIFKEVTNNEK